MPQIIDLNGTRIIKNEKYFIDTNVWYWLTYVASKQIELPNKPSDYQISDYPAFIEAAINSDAKLCHCPLSYLELANIIERTEFELYKETIDNEYLQKKEFRKNKKERKKVINEINMAWTTINNMSNCIDMKLDSEFVSESNNIIAKSRLDTIDAFFIQVMKLNKIDYIVTDDIDFSTSHNTIVITANPRALQ